MEEFYFFWNTFNLVAILTGVLSIGLFCGAIVTSIISVVTQIEDYTISFLGKLVGFLLGVYLSAPIVLSNYSLFAERIWGGSDIFK